MTAHGGLSGLSWHLYAQCCWLISCWAGNMGAAGLHLGQRWTPVSACSTMWQQTDFHGRAQVSLSLLLQQARQRGTAKGWKVVFVSRSLPHTVVHSLVWLGVFSHWQMPVWQRQDGVTAAVGCRFYVCTRRCETPKRTTSSGKTNPSQPVFTCPLRKTSS